MIKIIELMKWVDKAKEYIESDARDRQYPKAIELVKEHDELIKKFK